MEHQTVIIETKNGNADSVVELGDRIRWSYAGDCDFGTVSKINRKTFVCEGSNKYSKRVIVQKELVFEVIRFYTNNVKVTPAR